MSTILLLKAQSPVAHQGWRWKYFCQVQRKYISSTWEQLMGSLEHRDIFLEFFQKIVS